MTLARAVEDPNLSEEILSTARQGFGSSAESAIGARGRGRDHAGAVALDKTAAAAPDKRPRSWLRGSLHGGSV